MQMHKCIYKGKNKKKVSIDKETETESITRLATGQWCTPVSSTNKTDRHDITKIVLKVALNAITLIHNHIQNQLRVVIKLFSGRIRLICIE
jgi:hypothetical protein